jgi:hypothetical protein
MKQTLIIYGGMPRFRDQLSGSCRIFRDTIRATSALLS